MIPPELIRQLQAEGTLTLSLRVIPKASRDEIVGVLEDGSVKVKITAAPEKGKANSALCELLAAEFGVPRRNVNVVRGETSHNKQVRILSLKTGA